MVFNEHCSDLPPSENTKVQLNGRISSGNMVLMQIVVFKCKVNVCDQDLGAFCREWDPETKERFCGQLGATKMVAEEVLEVKEAIQK